MCRARGDWRTGCLTGAAPARRRRPRYVETDRNHTRPRAARDRCPVVRSPLRDAGSACRDWPKRFVTPSIASQTSVQCNSATDRQHRNPHSVRRTVSPHLPRFPPLEVCVRRPRCAPRHLHGAGIRKPSQQRKSPFHSITSSARCWRDRGTSRSSTFAVFRLMTSSYAVGNWTGRSAGFAPLKIWSTYVAARRQWSV
jgi:hypothetical protein